MQVVLLKDVKGVGKKGELITANDGYAVNYLIPNGIATSKTGGEGRELIKKVKEKREENSLKKSDELADFLKLPESVDINELVNEDGKLFNSIQPKSFVAILEKQGIVSRENWFSFETIKERGEYEINAKCQNKTRKVKIKIK